jgi:hypothetical protein
LNKPFSNKYIPDLSILKKKRQVNITNILLYNSTVNLCTKGRRRVDAKASRLLIVVEFHGVRFQFAAGLLHNGPEGVVGGGGVSCQVEGDGDGEVLKVTALVLLLPAMLTSRLW